MFFSFILRCAPGDILPYLQPHKRGKHAGASARTKHKIAKGVIFMFPLRRTSFSLLQPYENASSQRALRQYMGPLQNVTQCDAVQRVGAKE